MPDERTDRDGDPPATHVAVVDGFGHGGEGVARVDGKAVFVGGTIPGERIELRITEDHPRWARGELIDVLEPSEDRVTPPCPYVPECGGCDLQHVAPDRQRELKRRVVTEQLEHIGKLQDPPVAPTRAVGPDVRYRSNAQFHADDDGRLGYHRAGTNEVVPVDQCLVLGEAPQAVRDQVGDDTGAVEVTVRAHPSTGTAAAVLEPGEDPLDVPDGDFDLLLRQPDGSTLAMRGDGLLAEEVAGYRFTFDTTCFFQVNTGGAEAIVEEVREALGRRDGALVWDLYAGVGLLAVPLAADGAEVVAVESHATSARFLGDNAAANDVEVTVVDEPVEDFVLGAGAAVPDLVVLDPPRAGAGTEVVTALAELRPAAIIYVSCDPASLARDARALADAGFTLEAATPLDLFPMTHHVEVVASFRPL